MNARRRSPRRVLAAAIVLAAMGMSPRPTAAARSPRPPAKAGPRETALHQAIREGRTEEVRKLVAAGADVNARDKSGWAPLHMAAYRGDPAIIEALLRAGAAVNPKEPGGRTPYAWAVQRENHAAAAVLQRHGGNDGQPVLTPAVAALFDSVARGDAAGVRKYLDAGGSLEVHGRFGRTPLHEAVIQRRAEIVRLLLDRGATPGSLDDARYTPLHHTIPDLELAKLLLAKGAAADPVARDGATPLWLACFRGGSAEMVRLFLSKGANASARVKDGRTPLHHAATGEIARLLLDHDAKLEARTATGCTPLLFAAVWGRRDTAAELIKRGAKLEAKDADGRTPLSAATERGHPDVAELLRQAGATR